MSDGRKITRIYAALAVMILALVTVNAFPQQTWHLLLVLAVGLVAWGWRGLSRYRALRRWTPVKARLLSFEEVAEKVSTSELSSMQYYHPVATYEYEIDGRTWQSDQVSLEKRNIWVPEKDAQDQVIPASSRAWHDWAAGGEIEAFVNPARPSEAVLIRDMHASRYSHYRSFVVAGVIGGLIWLVLLVVLRD